MLESKNIHQSPTHQKACVVGSILYRPAGNAGFALLQIGRATARGLLCHSKTPDLADKNQKSRYFVGSWLVITVMIKTNVIWLDGVLLIMCYAFI